METVPMKSRLLKKCGYNADMFKDFIQKIKKLDLKKETIEYINNFDLYWSPVFMRDLYYNILKDYNKTEMMEKLIPFPTHYYYWKENSCFMNAVIFCIMTMKTDYWRKKLLHPVDPKYAKVEYEITRLFFEEAKYTKECRTVIYKFFPTIGLMTENSTLDFLESLDIVFDFSNKSPDPKFHFSIINQIGDGTAFFFIRGDTRYPTTLDDIKNIAPQPIIVSLSIEKLGQQPSLHEYFLENYKPVAAIIYTQRHYVSYSDTHYGVKYYDDLSPLIKDKTGIPVSGIETVFLIPKAKVG